MSLKPVRLNNIIFGNPDEFVLIAGPCVIESEISALRHAEQISKIADILELDKESILIEYLSDKILYELQDDDLGIKALKVAEKKIKCGVHKKMNK